MKNFYIIIFILTIIFSSCNKQNDTTSNEPTKDNIAQPKKNLTHSDTVFYSMGIMIGNQIKKYGIKDVNYNMLFQGIKDAIKYKSNQLPIDPDVAKQIASWYVNNAVSQKTIEYKQSNGNFFKLNAQKPGVKTISEGIQYKIIKSGKGRKPTLKDKVEIEYTGRLVDGTVFSGTMKNKTVSFYVKNSIKGWKIILPKMKVGAEWEIYLSPQYAFGSKGTPKVPPNSVVIYRIKLIKIFK